MSQLYNLYSGMGGGFGGMTFSDQVLCDSQEEAESEAYQLAVEEYESYAGYHGIRSEEEVQEEYCEDNGVSEEDLTEDDRTEIHCLYIEEVESWIEWKAVLASEDKEEVD